MKNKIITFVFFLLFSLSTTFLLTSCKGGTKSDEITIWWPSGKVVQNMMSDAIERFKVENPNIEIRVVKKAGLDIYDAYKMALNDNNSRPDIAVLDHVYVQALAHENQLANLSALGSDTECLPLFPETVYNANKYLGNNYGLPLSANTVCLMYNKDILNSCGITTIPQTIDELLAACEIVKSKGYIPFAQPINNTFVAMEFTSYVARLGGKLVSDDYKEVFLNSNLVKEAINKWIALSKYASKAEYEEGKFYNGKVAFIEMGSWNLSQVSGVSALFECGFSEMVSFNNEVPNYSGLGLYSFVVSEKSKNKEMAYKFAKFLSTDKTFQLAFAKEKNLLPVTMEALNDSYYKNDAALSVFTAQLQKVASRPGTPIWPIMERQIVDMMYSCVMSNTEEDITKAINRAQELCVEATNRKIK